MEGEEEEEAVRAMAHTRSVLTRSPPPADAAQQARAAAGWGLSNYDDVTLTIVGLVYGSLWLCGGLQCGGVEGVGPADPLQADLLGPAGPGQGRGRGGGKRQRPMLASVAWVWQYHSCPAITCRSRPTLSDPQQQAQGRAPFLLLYKRLAGRRIQ